MKFPFDKEIILENEKVLLRPLQISDLGNLIKVATKDKELLQFSPGQVYSEELLKVYIEAAIDGRLNKNRYAFTIVDKSNNAYAGSTGFLNMVDVDKRVEIGGTWIGKDFQRTGLNRQCKYLLLNFAFDELGAERVEFRTDERNNASRTAIEKIGGQYEGILRSHMFMYDGFRRNTVYYSILKNEWIQLKPGFLKRAEQLK